MVLSWVKFLPLAQLDLEHIPSKNGVGGSNPSRQALEVLGSLSSYKRSKEKRSSQLGMSVSTARAKLVMDLLYYMVMTHSSGTCARCGELLTRDSFTIDHMDPWLDSDDPFHKYFDVSNIQYSHLSCNSRASRRPHKKYFTEEEIKSASLEKGKRYRRNLPEKVRRERRRNRYLTHGY